MIERTRFCLEQLLPEQPPQMPQSVAALRVSGLCLDSRCVRPGDLFFARSGVNHRGADYIDDAFSRGAVAALVDAAEVGSEPLSGNGPVIPLADLDRQIGLIASRFNGEPSRALRVIGITGTNGKTSCAHYLAQALNSCGLPTALIGTVGNGFPGRLRTATHTTPDAPRLHAELARLRDEGAQAVVMEVSSHALEQQRVAGVHFAAVAYTNLSHDHLDYHGDMAHYAAAKARLFNDYGAPLQVLNADDDACARLLAQPCRAGGERIGFSLRPDGAEVFADQLTLGPQGMMFELHTPWGEVLVTAPLLGRFNAANLLLISTLLGGMGYEPGNIASALALLKPVSGRMERLVHAEAPTVIIDYAHTPDALEKALQATREHLPDGGRLWVVFGCGGDRDRAKRAPMGRIAADLADRLIITSDNPRGEDPLEIIRMVAEGVPAGTALELEADRGQAIDRAVAAADPRDIILLAGKGHETWQEIQGVKHPFSDQAQVKAAQAARSGS